MLLFLPHIKFFCYNYRNDLPQHTEKMGIILNFVNVTLTINRL